MSKKVKNNRKLLRATCSNCGTVHDLFRMQCKNCGSALHAEDLKEDMETVKGHVSELEAILKDLQGRTLKQGNPYEPLDRAREIFNRANRYRDRFDIGDYLDRTKIAFIPFRLQLMRQTFRANLILTLILAALALLPLLLGWSPMVFGLMGLPALVWAGVTVKAWLDISKVASELPPED